MWFCRGGTSLEIVESTSLSWEAESNLSTSSSASGFMRANYFGGSHVLRKMSLSHEMLQPAEHGKIGALTQLGFGTEFAFIPTGAERSNLLFPAASMLGKLPGYQSRMLTTDSSGNVYPGGVNTGSTYVEIMEGAPYPFGGKDAVVSAVGKDGASLVLYFYDNLGANIAAPSLNMTGTSYERVSRVITPPSGSVSYSIRVKGDIAAPALTIGTKLYPWTVGQSAKNVIIKSASGALLAAWDKNTGTYNSADYTIQEVGEYV